MILFRLSLMLVLGSWLQTDLRAATAPARVCLCCRAENDLWQVLRSNGVECARYDTAQETLAAAKEGGAALILADGYPERTTEVPRSVFEEAARKRVRVYVEYPGEVPGLKTGTPIAAKKERGVVTSDVFGSALPALSIVMINGCRYVPVEAGNPHLVLAKVAGVDVAVFGLKDAKAVPILFDAPGGGVLVATTKLSQFVTGRYMPAASWGVIWETILSRLGAPVATLRWTPTVRPTYGPREPLPAAAEAKAVARSAEWIRRSRVLRHAQWPESALKWSMSYNTVREMPSAEWPAGDGSLGVVEGFNSTIRSDGSQPMRYAVRNDCMTEVAMLLSLAATTTGVAEQAQAARELLNYDFLRSGLTSAPRADPEQASCGLMGWALDSPGAY